MTNRRHPNIGALAIRRRGMTRSGAMCLNHEAITGWFSHDVIHLLRALQSDKAE
jgi:hypothetical protein